MIVIKKGIREFVIDSGLTKREYFAAMAMQGLLAKEAWLERNEHDIKFNTIIAKASVSIADQLLKELENDSN